MKAVFIGFLVLLNSALAFAAEVDTDRAGADYRNLELNLPDAGICETWCKADSQCQSWTYVKPGIQGPKARCYIKSSIPNRATNSCCISGLKLAEYDTDRMGSDYQALSLQQPDAAQCLSLCKMDSKCRAWTYVNPGLAGPQAMCWLKDSAPKATASTCCTSGVEHEPSFGNEAWQIKVKHSGKCLDVKKFSTAIGGDIVQSHCTANPVQPNQAWHITQGSINSPKRLVAEHSGMAMDVLYGSSAHAADVVQLPQTGHWSGAAMWDFFYVKTVNGVKWYLIVNQQSHLCLDVAFFDMTDGGNVLQANCTQTDNQLWDFYNIKLNFHGW